MADSSLGNLPFYDIGDVGNLERYKNIKEEISKEISSFIYGCA